MLQEFPQYYKLKDANKFFASMNYNFFLKDQPDKNGDSPIYLNLTISGKRSRIPLEMKIKPEYWDKANKNFYGFDQAKDYNLILEQIVAKITSIKVRHRLNEIPLTLNSFIENFKNAPPTYDFHQFFNYALKFQDLGESTKLKHQGVFNKLKDYNNNLAFADFNLMWFDKYRNYLILNLKNNSSTVNTNISIIKKYLKLAQDYGIKIYINLDHIKVGPTAGRIIWLNQLEIDKLEEYYYSKFIPDHLKLSLGYFLFSCYSGLRVSDVLARTRDDVEVEIFNFISIKTKKQQLVGCSKRCKKVIDHCDKLFYEKKSETNINMQLKAIAKSCGITKNLYFHVARHSFATNYLLKGGNVQNLQKLLGHSKITTTMKYVHVLDYEAAITVNVFD